MNWGLNIRDRAFLRQEEDTGSIAGPWRGVVSF